MAKINAFRVLADVSHTASIFILIWAIHSNRSAEGISLITQVLYATVFLARYTESIFYGINGEDELLEAHHGLRLTVFLMKILYIFTSLYIIFIMMRVFARTRERERAWRFGGYCAAGSIMAAPFVMMIFEPKKMWSFGEVIWTFSIILESVCVLPQLLLLRQTTVPTVIDSFYLVTLGSYRAFYILNWIIRAAQEIPTHRYFDWIGPVFGIIQTAFYIDFAWVYWSRQRVKLRNGGVVDSEDLSHGWLISKITGSRIAPQEEAVERPETLREEEYGEPETGRRTPRTENVGHNKWGQRGISISADDEDLETAPLAQNHRDDMVHPDDFD
ncbi:hypothetical protein MMC25_003046 [Agyrium rufum]|nr:hypothetical protein [Agyrium rufum]